MSASPRAARSPNPTSSSRLENALRIGGVALVRDDTGYRLMPQGDAVGVGGADASDRMTPGYGITIVPLQYVSAQTVIKLVDSFATKQGMIRADTSRNLILIQGSGSERRNAVDLVLSFDADFLKGQSVGIFPVQNSNPGPIIAELEKIVDSGEGGMTQNVIKFQSIARMNAVLAVTRKPELLNRVRNLDPPPRHHQYRPLGGPRLPREVRRRPADRAGAQRRLRFEQLFRLVRLSARQPGWTGRTRIRPRLELERRLCAQPPVGLAQSVKQRLWLEFRRTRRKRGCFRRVYRQSGRLRFIIRFAGRRQPVRQLLHRTEFRPRRRRSRQRSRRCPHHCRQRQ
ncbi:hypothetical protein ACVW0J_007984 [Bradyrhizobium sp. i1.7.7]